MNKHELKVMDELMFLDWARNSIRYSTLMKEMWQAYKEGKK